MSKSDESAPYTEPIDKQSILDTINDSYDEK